MSDLTKTQLTAKFIDGPIAGKEYARSSFKIVDGVRQFVGRIQVPFATDEEYINAWGELMRKFAYVTYELKTLIDPLEDKTEFVYCVVDDNDLRLWQKFKDNPELVGVKWHEDDEPIFAKDIE